MAWATAAAALSVASSIGGMLSGFSSNSAARDAARRQSKMVYAQRMEEIRRQEYENEYINSANKLSMYESNLMPTGSAKSVLMNIQNQMASEVAWQKGAAAMERRAIRKGAPGASANWGIAAQGIADIGSTILRYKGSS